LTQKEYWIYRVFLYIVVDTERIMDILGIFIYLCWHRKNIWYIGYFYIFVLTQKVKGIYRVFLFNLCT